MLRGLGVPALARGARFPSPSSSPCTPAIASPSTAWSRTGAGRTAPRAWSSRSGARTSTGRRRRSAPPAGSVQREHRLAREAPGHEVLRDLTDLLPGPLEAHVGYELPRRHELGEPPEAHRRGLRRELGEDVEAVQRRAPGGEELPRVEGDLGAGGDTEGDADATPREGGQRRAERAPAPSGRTRATRAPTGGFERSAAGCSISPARSQPGRQPAAAMPARRTSPRLSEIARTRTTASPRSGEDGRTDWMTSRPGASGSTTTARLVVTAHLPGDGRRSRIPSGSPPCRSRPGAGRTASPS